MLHVGSLSAAACLTVGFVLNLVNLDEPARLISLAGVLVLLGTPPAALLTTFAEMRAVQPRAAWLAVVVLVTLALAAGAAVPSGKKDKEEHEEDEDVYFFYKTVFDISQTEELPVYN